MKAGERVGEGGGKEEETTTVQQQIRETKGKNSDNSYFNRSVLSGWLSWRSTQTHLDDKKKKTDRMEQRQTHLIKNTTTVPHSQHSIRSKYRLSFKTF